jgi:hypothetical protein
LHVMYSSSSPIQSEWCMLLLLWHDWLTWFWILALEYSRCKYMYSEWVLCAPSSCIMATKWKATIADNDADEIPPMRWQRLETLSWNDLNDHRILEILSYLEVEELMNPSIVFINSHYRELRNHDSLNQTHTGTIVCTDTTINSLNHTYTEHMKVIGIEWVRPAM